MNWISMEEQTPALGQLCLVFDAELYAVAYYTPGEKGQYCQGNWTYTICPCCELGTITPTHWAAVTEKPE